MLFRAASSAAILLLGVSCSTPPYRPVSHLITHSLDAEKAHGSFTGIWHQGASAHPRQKKGTQYVYVAPVDMEAIRQRFPEAAPYLAREFRDSLQKEVQQVIEDRNAKAGNVFRWKLTDRPRTPGMQISLAIVQLKPTDVGGKVVALGVGIVSPIPGVSFMINHFSSGAVGIEGNISSLDSSSSLTEFSGHNTDPIRAHLTNVFTIA